jgi:hypothetical protein
MEKKKTRKRRKNKKNNFIKNNYNVIIGFILVIIIVLMVFTDKEEAEFETLDPIFNNIAAPDNGIIFEETDLISNLRKIPNGGDINTFKIYQSMYTNETINMSSLNTENILYITYKYIENIYDLSKYNKYITCDIASKVNLDKNIYQCGGNKHSITTYQYNTLLNKKLIKDTAEKIFNINIKDFTNFYTNEDNLCYFVEDDFICVTKRIKNTKDSFNKDFVSATIKDNKIEIIEEYYYINNDIKHKYFKSTEEGSSLFISTFEKTNGYYHWIETKPYKN